jgi:lysozyme
MNVKPDYNLLCGLLEHFEGFYPNAYQDTGGVWTLGFGSTRNFDKNRMVQKGDTISKEDAIRYVQIECQSIETYLNKYIRVSLTPYQSAALVDYVYNRGIGNFLKTKLDELINENVLNPAIKNEFLGTGLWDRMGNKLWGLGRRRRSEYHLFSTGNLKFDWKKWG